MPPVRFLAFKRYAYIVALILLLSEIMPTYSHYIVKGLVYIIIAALFNQQPSSCFKCIKLNIYSSCDIQLVSTDKCAYYIYLTTF
jgi:hypothetical protein